MRKICWMLPPLERPEEVETPFHEPLEQEEILAAHEGLSTGSREEGPSQQGN
ncbi:hypothetical protein BH09VER1_BH09VER1_21670 [soil metagenome]